jgi:hypothetical protein
MILATTTRTATFSENDLAQLDVDLQSLKLILAELVIREGSRRALVDVGSPEDYGVDPQLANIDEVHLTDEAKALREVYTSRLSDREKYHHRLFQVDLMDRIDRIASTLIHAGIEIHNF